MVKTRRLCSSRASLSRLEAPPHLCTAALCAAEWSVGHLSPTVQPRSLSEAPPESALRLTIQVLAWFGALLGALVALLLSDVVRCYAPPILALRRKIAVMTSEGSTRPSDGKLSVSSE